MSQTVRPTELEKARASLEKDAPTGPPPSFEESYLARQAREALKPSQISREGDGEGDALPKTNAETRAETGFAEIRALAAEPAKALMDKRA